MSNRGGWVREHALPTRQEVAEGYSEDACVHCAVYRERWTHKNKCVARRSRAERTTGLVARHPDEEAA